MTYLELCRNYVQELGIAGGTGPAAVTGQTGELANVIRWIRDAGIYIDNLWMDWSYLWREYDVSVTTSAVPMPALPANAPVKTWDRGSMWMSYGTAAARRLTYVPWDEWRVMLAGGITSGIPSEFTEKPNRSLVLNHVPPSPLPFHAEYWRQPRALEANDDVPDLPEQWHRIIICRAAIMYGNREAAGEIISGMEAEYADTLEKLQSDQIPAFRHERMGGQDVALQVEVP